MQPTVQSAVTVAAIATTLALTAIFLIAAYWPHQSAEWPLEAGDYVCDGPYQPRVVSDGVGHRFVVCDPIGGS